jgi:hypothetical protein
MGKVHVECLPDETLVKKLGVTRKMVNHHAGKSRVFSKLKTTYGEIAMVDEDPGSVKTDYEKNLIFIDNSHGIRVYKDERDNRILILNGKLEDWIIATCKTANINISLFGLPDRPNDLHGIINLRLSGFEKLIEHLKNDNNPGIILLMSLLT